MKRKENTEGGGEGETKGESGEEEETGKGRRSQVQREWRGGQGCAGSSGRVGRSRAEPREASAWKGSQLRAGGVGVGSWGMEAGKMGGSGRW